MFCLSPLGAIDLNQDDNNTKYVNVKDNASNILVDDEKSTDVDVKADVSGINSSTGNDSDIKNLNDTKLNSSNSQLSKKSPNLSAHIEDITYGEVPVVEVYADKGLHARVAMECPDFENYYKVIIKDGYFKYRFNEYHLEPGDYVVTLSTIGDNDYVPQEITTKFTVRKVSTNIKAQPINNVAYGEKAVINVLANERFNGTANVTLINTATDEPHKFIPMKFNEGKGNITVDNLTPGYYRSIVEFHGDKYFYDSGDEKSFTVYGNSNPNLRVEVDDIQYGEHPKFRLYANESADGFVWISTNNSDKRIFSQIENGYLERNVFEDFEIGTYSACINYAGDNVFKPETKNITFNVVKADSNLSIYVEKTSVWSPFLHVEVDAKEKVNGTVEITLNNRVNTKNLQLVNGHGEFDYTNTDYFPGNYTALAKYEGNEYFNAANATTRYEVLPKQ